MAAPSIVILFASRPTQLVLILHLIPPQILDIAIVIVGPWRWRRLLGILSTKESTKDIFISSQSSAHWWRVLSNTLRFYLRVWLTVTGVTSPWYVFLAAKARRLSGCWGGNMFIGFTAVTGTSRMSWECKHRPLDIPFLRTSHSSLVPSLHLAPDKLASHWLSTGWLVARQLARICGSVPPPNLTLSPDDSLCETWELCNWLYGRTDERPASVVSRIIQLFSSFQLLTAPCKYCSFFVHCHPTRLGGAIAAIDGAIEGGSPP